MPQKLALISALLICTFVSSFGCPGQGGTPGTHGPDLTQFISVSPDVEPVTQAIPAEGGSVDLAGAGSAEVPANTAANLSVSLTSGALTDAGAADFTQF